MLEQVKQVEGRRLYQQIADQIRALIQQGRFRPGTRLPTERELAQQLRVSRPSVREALIALEIEGSVEVRMGAGVYVGKVSDRPASSLADSLGDSPIELMHARVMLEGEVIVQACAVGYKIRFSDHVSPGTYASVPLGIEIGLRGFREAPDPQGTGGPERVRLALAGSRLAAVQRLGGYPRAPAPDLAHAPRLEPMLFSVILDEGHVRRTWVHAVEEHEAILQALEARDALAAQARMRQHLHASAQRWVDEGQNDWA